MNRRATAAASDLQTARDDIRAAGLRATPGRSATLILLRESSSPLTHADVANQLARTGVDKATTFRVDKAVPWGVFIVAVLVVKGGCGEARHGSRRGAGGLY